MKGLIFPLFSLQYLLVLFSSVHATFFNMPGAKNVPDLTKGKDTIPQANMPSFQNSDATAMSEQMRTFITQQISKNMQNSEAIHEQAKNMESSFSPVIKRRAYFDDEGYGFDYTRYEYGFNAYEVLHYVNRLRYQVGVNPLRLNHKLMEAAQRHSEHQWGTENMSHYGYHGSTADDRVRLTGYNSMGSGENVAWNQKSEYEVVRTWEFSPGHYRNMVNPSFTEMGIGMRGWYWTQVFGAGDY